MSEPRILLVTPVSALASAFGAEQRSHLVLEALSRLGLVDIVELREASPFEMGAAEPWSHAFGERQASGLRLRVACPARRLPWLRYRPWPGLREAVEQRLGRRLSDYALVMGRYLWPLSQLGGPRLRHSLVDLDDWRVRFDRSGPPLHTAWHQRLRKAVNTRLAQGQLKRFELAFAVSAQDEAELALQLPTRRLPNVALNLPASVLPPPAGGPVLFVGSIWHEPNAQAADWLCRVVWPRVRALQPEARLRIIGSGRDPLRQQWAALPGIEAPGYVDDLAQAYAEASAVAAPVFSGGGSNIKVLEALGHGRPCVVTPLVQAAFTPQLQDGQQLHVARGADAFAQRLAQLIATPDTASAAAGRQVVQAQFSRSAFVDFLASTAWQHMARRSAAARRPKPTP